MSKKRFNPMLFCQSTNVCILKRLKYDVPKEKEKPTVLRIALAYIFPTAITVISFLMFEMTLLVFLLNGIGLFLNYFLAKVDYENYCKQFNEQSSSAMHTPENPLHTKTVILRFLLAMLILLMVLAIIDPNTLSFKAVWYICAVIDILGVWISNVTDALVNIYSAEYPR